MGLTPNLKISPTQEPPTEATLKKFGWTAEDWRNQAHLQGYQCPLCLRSPPEVVLVTDHVHVPQWKHRPPEHRRAWIRGLPCRRCNMQFLRPGMTAEIAVRMSQYLLDFERRRPQDQPIPKPKKKRRRKR